MINKVLIANRGEIAVRLIRGCRALGLASVAVYSDADAQALHVQSADEAVRLGPAPAAESYLAIDKLLAAAEATGANAIHPGYGFLAENADFAAAVEKAGLLFVGPSADAISLMGSKRVSKLRMQEAGVPCVPGYDGEDQDDATLIAEGQRIGAPVMVKASAGGGGRGMRRVDDIDALAAAIQGARSEAKSVFGSGELILEKAVIGARHVEIQVLADQAGHVIHLGERDCSVQRRHQKVVEEAPSPAVYPELREQMGRAAVDAAAAIGYCGAGTVEFLLAEDGAFYFMEMNTRLQVEHPVTEMVTGIDLVQWQLRIAAGEPLTLSQDDVTFNGHAVEVRWCVEDVDQDFMPQTGRLHQWRPPAGEGIRVDHGLVEGQTIGADYDSMVGKFIAWGETRDAALRRLRAALDDTRWFGPVCNRDFLARILAHPDFAAGDCDTGFIDTHADELLIETDSSPRRLALAAALMHADQAASLASARDLSAPLVDWRSAYSNESPIVLVQGDNRHTLRLSCSGERRYRVCVDEDWIDIELDAPTGETVTYHQNGVTRRAVYWRDGHCLWLRSDGQTLCYEDALRMPQTSADEAGDGRIEARMDGLIQRVDVVEGQSVSAGDILLVLEAMKMEFSLEADIDGIIESVHCAAGDQVAARQPLVAIQPAEGDGAS